MKSEVVLSPVVVSLFEPKYGIRALAPRALLAQAGLAGLVILCSAGPARAQDGAVKATFEKFNLFGVFAPDCSLRPNPVVNLYYVVRPIDAGHVQLDTMASPTNRIEVAVIDRAWRMSADQIGIMGTDDGRPVAGVWRVDKNSVLQLEAIVAGEPTVASGKFLKTGADIPWLDRCSQP